MKMITAVAAAATLAMSGVAFAGGPVATKKEPEPAPPVIVPSSAVGSLGAGGPAIVAGLAALALVAALANDGDDSSTGTTAAPASN